MYSTLPQRPPQQRRRRSKRKLIVLVFVILIVGAGGYKFTHHATTAPSVVTPVAKKPAPKNAVRIIATGDMLPHDAINKNAKTATGYNYAQFFTRVAPYMKSGDVRYCNQESPSDGALGVSGYPTFNAPVSFAQTLHNQGCNVINLANNHADDRGQAGIDATIDVWKGLNPLAIAGTNKSVEDQQKITYFTVKGIKFAYIGFAECSNNKGVSDYGLNLLSNTELVQGEVRAAVDNADFVIAGLHSCTEGTRTPDAAIKTWSKYMADNGVKAVIGTGPHWLQSVDRLPRMGGGDTVVWYSLGNFLSAQTDVPGLIGGIAVMDVNTSTKQISSIGFLPTYMHYEWTAQQKASNDLLARHNFMLYPLDQSAQALARSQNNTTVEAQTKIVTDLMNQNTSVPILTSHNSYK